MLSGCALVVPLLAASFIVRWQDLRASWLFIVLSIWAVQGPALVLSFISTDLSSFIGGMIGVLLVGVLAHFKIGLGAHPGHKFETPHATSPSSEEDPVQLRHKLDLHQDSTTQLSNGERCTTRSNDVFDESTVLANTGDSIPNRAARSPEPAVIQVSGISPGSSGRKSSADEPVQNNGSSLSVAAPQHRGHTSRPLGEALEDSKQLVGSFQELFYRPFQGRHAADAALPGQELQSVTVECCRSPSAGHSSAHCSTVVGRLPAHNACAERRKVHLGVLACSTHSWQRGNRRTGAAVGEGVEDDMFLTATEDSPATDQDTPTERARNGALDSQPVSPRAQSGEGRPIGMCNNSSLLNDGSLVQGLQVVCTCQMIFWGSRSCLKDLSLQSLLQACSEYTILPDSLLAKGFKLPCIL
jgi:hypothetical protein